MSEFGAFVALILFFVICLIAYFFPAIIAGSRKHPNATPITVLNLFLGWTLVGWVAALVWALTVSPAAPKTAEVEDERRRCPSCGESISIHAHVCRFCNRPLASDRAEPLLLQRRAS